MPVITSYDTLIQAIKDVTEDDGVEFVAYLPTAIDIAEERLYRELELGDLKSLVTNVLTQNVATLSKPADYEFPYSLHVIVGNKRKQLRHRTDDYIKDYWPDQSLTDVPKYYTNMFSETQFLLAPTPSNSYTYELRYSAKPEKLSVTNQTNYYTTNCQDALYFACLVEVSKFMKAWEQVDIWEQEFVKVRDAWNIKAFRERRDDGEVPNAHASGPNTLKHTIQSKS